MKIRVLFAVAIVAVLVACSSEPIELTGFVRTPQPDLSGTSLPDASADGAEFVMRAPEGEILVVYFGYTACPDVCPTTLADLRSALRKIGPDADVVTVAMATIDPERDSDDIISGYVQSFVPEAHGLRTADPAEFRP